MNKLLVYYKVYSDIITQRRTSIDLSKVPEDVNNSWLYVSELLRNRFKGYRVKVNHLGKTVRVEVKYNDI